MLSSYYYLYPFICKTITIYYYYNIVFLYTAGQLVNFTKGSIKSNLSNESTFNLTFNSKI